MFNNFFNNKGHIYQTQNIENYSLEFSTLSALQIMNAFYSLDTPCLSRKKDKYDEALKYRIQINPRAKDTSKEDEKVC